MTIVGQSKPKKCVDRKDLDFSRRANSPQSFTDDLIRFCLFSSVRGAPRILRSKSKLWSCIWLISLSGFLGISLYFIGKLVTTYLTYQTVFEVTADYYEGTTPFPSVTVCNLQPFSSSMISRFKNSSYPSTLNTFKMLSSVDKYSEIFKSVSERSFLYQNWGMTKVLNQSFQFNDFVVRNSCNVTFITNAKQRIESCDSDTDVIPIPNPNFFMCYMISPKTNISNATLSLEMDLYLDTESDVLCSDEYCEMSAYQLDDSIGVHVVVDGPHKYPEINRLGVHVLPGTKSVMEIIDVKHTIKEIGLGKCLQTSDKNADVFIGTSKPEKFAYSTTFCRDLSTQHRILQKCNCTLPEFPLSFSMRDAIFCGHLKEGNSSTSINDMTHRYTCAVTEEFDPRNLDSESAEEQCKQPCNSFSYQTSAYQSRWPPRINEMDYYTLRIRNKSLFRDKFLVYEHVYNHMKAGNLSRARQLLNGGHTSLMRENFLRLKIFRPDFSVIRSKEKLQITLEALISQIGGSFSLWGGLTIITVVEIVEFMYYLTKRFILFCNEKYFLKSKAKEKTKIEEREVPAFLSNYTMQTCNQFVQDIGDPTPKQLGFNPLGPNNGRGFQYSS